MYVILIYTGICVIYSIMSVCYCDDKKEKTSEASHDIPTIIL